jgi:hypothetical protein
MRVLLVVFGLGSMAYASFAFVHGSAMVGWRYGPGYEVRGVEAYLVAGGCFAIGLGGIALGVHPRRVLRLIAIASSLGILLWMAVLLYTTATR